MTYDRGDVRAQSQGEHYPFSLVGAGHDGWVVVDLRNNIDNQIASARLNGNVYPYGDAAAATPKLDTLKRLHKG